MVDLSIIIVSYNTAQITLDCLNSIFKSLDDRITYEIIVIDNASTDSSQSQISRLRQDYGGQAKFKTIFNTLNTGFAKANNQGVKVAQGKYILFINSDVIIEKINFQELISYFEKNSQVGALTVKVNLQQNGIDPASHRGFPTLWRSLTYFTGLERSLGKFSLFKKIFGGYHLLHNDFSKVHEIDSPSGAFFMIRKDIFNQVNGFDESFFMYGEDLDLAYRIKGLGYKIIYYPKFVVTHLKYQSGLKNESKVAVKIKKHFYEAMKIFYDKHYARKNNFIVNGLIHSLINLKELIS